MEKKFFALLMCAIIIAGLVSCAGSTHPSITNKAFVKPKNYNVLTDSFICENDDYILEWDFIYSKVVLRDKETNNAWSTTPLDANGDEVDEWGFNIGEATPVVNSPIIVNYINSRTRGIEQAFSYTQSIKESTIDVVKIENGVLVTYFFNDLEFSIPVTYTLSENGLQISLDPTQITEGTNKVYSVELAPNLCSIKNESEDAYLFVPSGSGALIEAKNLSFEGSRYEEEVYGYDLSKHTYDLVSNTKQINLPVFGYKSGESGGFIIIHSGAEYATIKGNIGSQSNKYSNLGVNFVVRGMDSIQVSSNVMVSSVQNVYADCFIQEKVVLDFYPLFGEDANYNKMADLYREYLIENHGLNKDESEDSSLHLRFLGAAYVDKNFLGVPYKSLYAMTEFSDVEEILKQIEKNTDNSYSVELKGFGKSGLDTKKIAGGYKISNKLGTVEELKKLQSDFYAPFYFDFNILDFSKSGGSFSIFSDVPKGPTGLKMYQYLYDTATRSMDENTKYASLSRRKLISSADRLISKIDNWDLNGIGINRLSYVAYSDYSDIKYYAKGNMSKDASEIIKKYKSVNYNILSSDANAYAACLSDEITDVPSVSSKNDNFSVEIPFYQMVFKGHVSLSSTPINLEANSKLAILRALEGGTALTYTIIADYDTALVNSSHKELHSSLYSGISKEIFNVANDTAEFYDLINGAEITNFEVLSENLRKVVFSNDVVLYTNHSPDTEECEVGTVEGYGFIYKEGKQ